MGKYVNSFEEFDKVNEEITDTYLTKKINKAKEEGRDISTGYIRNLSAKKDELNKAANIREVEAEKKTKEESFAKMTNLTQRLNNELEGQLFDFEGKSEKLFPRANAFTDGSGLEITLATSGGQIVAKVVYMVESDNLITYTRLTKDSGLEKDSLYKISNLIPFLKKMFKDNFPESKYADRKIWSALESHVVRFEDFENISEELSGKEKYQDELDKELAWVRKYSKYVDRGSYPKDDYDDEDEFYSDLEKTENNIERLKKLIKK